MTMTTMTMTSTVRWLTVATAALLLLLASSPAEAWAPVSVSTTLTTRRSLQGNNNNNANDNNSDDNCNTVPSPAVTSRRSWFTSGVAAAAALATTTSTFTTHPSPAWATYSAYTRREQDWESRKEKGEIQYSSARDLRQQLREIAPMNTENSRIFCPNGPSAAVSPLMENKCGDRMAIPSVYGRTDDILGNSIPGYANGARYQMPGAFAIDSSVGLAAAGGGFPSYESTTGGSKK